MELKYINMYGEVLQLKQLVNTQIVFNHTDIHEDNQFEDISCCEQYILMKDEVKVIEGFMKICISLL